jgi:hypothetical protein
MRIRAMPTHCLQQANIRIDAGRGEPDGGIVLDLPGTRITGFTVAGLVHRAVAGLAR